jgi:hypothetical protein
MRLARLVVAGLALGAAIGFFGALVRPRSVHHAILAATIGVGAVGSGNPVGAEFGRGAVTTGHPSSSAARSLGVPALTSSGGAC